MAARLDPVCSHCVEERNDLAACLWRGRRVMVCGACRDAFAREDHAYLATCNDSPDRSRIAAEGARKPSLEELDREESP
jgi:hypothetical protein